MLYRTSLQVVAEGVLPTTALWEYGNCWTVLLVCAEVGRIMFPLLLPSTCHLLLLPFSFTKVMECPVRSRGTISSVSQRTPGEEAPRGSLQDTNTQGNSHLVL